MSLVKLVAALRLAFCGYFVLLEMTPLVKQLPRRLFRLVLSLCVRFPLCGFLLLFDINAK